MRDSRIATTVLLFCAVAGCGGLRLGSRPADTPAGSESASGRTPGRAASAEPGQRDAEAPAVSVVDFNRRIGMIAHGAPLPFSGRLAYFASDTPDSTHILVSLTLAPSALVFRRETDVLERAEYRVVLQLKRGDEVVSRTDAVETVRVGSVREAASAENSIIFQQLLTAAPGAYTLSVAVNDEASAKRGVVEVAANAPAFRQADVSTPVAYFELVPRTARDSLPRVVSNPRALFVFAHDSTADFYIEAYGQPEATRLHAAVEVEGTRIWTDSIQLRAVDATLSSANIKVPVTRLAPGIAYLVAWMPGSADTVRTPFFITYGDPVPATTFGDMVLYLRYFAPEERLRTLLAAKPPARGLAWANFYRETDPNPSTLVNEALTTYLERLRYVEAQFSEGGVPGWRTDRGMVYLLFGQYDQALDPFAASAQLGERGRSLQWEYRSLNLSVEFVRTGTFGQWRLTPASEQSVRSAARKQLGGDILR